MTSQTHEVRVALPVPVRIYAHNEPTSAAEADHGGLQLVVVAALLLALTVSAIHDVLDALPNRLRDEGFMLSVVENAAIENLAGVIGVTSEPVQLADTQRLGR